MKNNKSKTITASKKGSQLELPKLIPHTKETQLTPLKSYHEMQINGRVGFIEKCLREGTFIFFGVDSKESFISGNVFTENECRMKEYFYDTLLDEYDYQLFARYVLYLNNILLNHPACDRDEIEKEMKVGNYRDK